MTVCGACLKVRSRKWTIVTLVLISFLLGSAFYNTNSAYVIHVDASDKVTKSNVIGESKTNDYQAPKLMRSRHNLGIKSKKGRLITVNENPVTNDEYLDNVKVATKKLVDEIMAVNENTDGNSNRTNNRTGSTENGKYGHNYFGQSDQTLTTTATLSTASSLFGNKSESTQPYSPSTRKGEIPWDFSNRRNKFHRARSGTGIASGFKNSLRKRPKIKYDIPIRPDTEYAIPDLESLRINKTQSSTLVLLVTYARSGSSWLGAITNQADETFYVFEPLQRILVQGYYRENKVCFNNNTCRKPRLLFESHRFAITTFHRLFTCQFTKLHPKAVQVFVRNVRTGNINECIKSSFSVMKCLKKFEEICRATSHRALKTIRISMELVNIMMDLWPNLKVVHLVRDPRGITNSRIKAKTFSMAKKTVPHSHYVCELMYDDVIYNTEMEKKFKNRTTLVFYEALAEKPLEGVQFIYNFLDVPVTPEVEAWVYNSTHAQKKSGYYGTTRSNATESASHWRSQFTLIKVKIIDHICIELYNLLGFLPFNTSTRLHDTNVPSRKSIIHSNWFT